MKPCVRCGYFFEEDRYFPYRTVCWPCIASRPRHLRPVQIRPSWRRYALSQEQDWALHEVWIAPAEWHRRRNDTPPKTA